MAWYSIVIVVLVLALACDMYVRHRAWRRQRTLARTDELTQIDNRQTFFDTASREFERARRYGHPFTLVYFAVDDYNEVSIRFGHKVADEMLRVVARTARASSRATDSVARLGGDEFALLLPEAGPQAASAVVRKVRDALREASRETAWSLTIRGGAVTCLQPAESLENAVGSADQLLNAARRAGPDAFAFEVVAPQPLEGFEPARLRRPYRLPPSFEQMPPPPWQRRR